MNEAAGNANLPIGSKSDLPQEANQEIGVPSVWRREYRNRYIRDERHLRMAMEYIHTNPVKAGLVSKPEEWQWNSAYHPHTSKHPPSIRMHILASRQDNLRFAFIHFDLPLHGHIFVLQIR